MAIELSSLIFKVRDELSDLPTDFAKDHQIYEEIKRADAYIGKVVSTGVADDYKSKCIIAVAAYTAYVNYTSLSERQLGNVSQTTFIRLNVLRQIALALISPVASLPLNPDLTVNTEALATTKGLGFMISESTLEDL